MQQATPFKYTIAKHVHLFRDYNVHATGYEDKPVISRTTENKILCCVVSLIHLILLFLNSFFFYNVYINKLHCKDRLDWVMQP
jgi:uncharacterized membrane protein YqhA